MARVFVSYSSELAAVPWDESFVTAAADAVSLAGHVPVYMKQFTAEPRPPAEVCRGSVESCQAFVALLGFRYGTPVRDEPERSYMELEFEHAGASGIPRLVFLLDPDAVTVGQAIDLDRPDLLPRQLAFRRTAQEDAKVTTASFRTPDRLRALVGRALGLLASDLAPLSSPKALQARRPAGIPPAVRCEGRALLSAALVGAVTGTGKGLDTAPLAILGPPGIGKSALAVAALYDAEVQRRFGKRRWFVRCDGASSGDALLNAVATELEVAAEGSAEGPAPTRARVQLALAEAPGLLVLDNLETPWHADPVGTEQTLRDLTGARVTVVATVRGLGRPAGVDWREPLVVPPLGANEAKDVFLAIAGKEFARDADLGYLLEQCDGVPLALELLAANAQGEPDLSELTVRWRSEKATLMRRGAGDRRELSVPVSLELSIQDRTMTGAARRLLSLLGVLPDGMGRDDLEALLPGTGLAGAGTLRRGGLAFDAAGRLRTLAPIREYVAATYPPSRDDLASTCVYYCQLAAALGERIGSAGGAEAAHRLAAVPGNLAAMIMMALSLGRTALAADAVAGSAVLDRFHGVTLPGVLDAVLAAVEQGDVARRADLLRAKGNVAVARSDYTRANEAYRLALPLYEQAGNSLGQSSCMQGLGDIALELGDHAVAEQAYRAAIPLLEETGDVLGQANCVRRLGDIALERLSAGSGHARGRRAGNGQGTGGQALGADLAGAESDYEQALAMFRQIGNLLGEARCIRRLGTIAIEQDNYEAAKNAFAEAMPMYQQVADVLGHGNCHLGLGDVAIAQGDHDAARVDYQQALTLFRQVGSLHAIGWTHLRLARLDGAAAERQAEVLAVRQVWSAIGRHDLLDQLDAEFPREHP